MRLNPIDKPSQKWDTIKPSSTMIPTKKRSTVHQPTKKKIQKTIPSSPKLFTTKRPTTCPPSEDACIHPTTLEQKIYENHTTPLTTNQLEFDFETIPTPNHNIFSPENNSPTDELLEDTAHQHVEDGEELYFDLKLTQHQFSPPQTPQAEETMENSLNLQDTFLFPPYPLVSRIQNARLSCTMSQIFYFSSQGKPY